MSSVQPAPVLRRYAPHIQYQQSTNEPTYQSINRHTRSLSLRIQSTIQAFEASTNRSTNRSTCSLPTTPPDIRSGHVAEVRAIFSPSINQSINQSTSRSTLPLPARRDSHQLTHQRSTSTSTAKDRVDDSSRTALISGIAKRRGQYNQPTNLDINQSTPLQGQIKTNDQSTNQSITSRLHNSLHHQSIARSEPSSPNLSSKQSINQSISQSINQSLKRPKSVRFQRSILLREYRRVVGGSGGIPRTGGVALGLDWQYIKQCKQRIPTNQSTGQSNNQSTNQHDMPIVPESPRRRYPTPASSKADELPRISEIDRRSLVSIDASIEDAEADELEKIRISRQTNFCNCQPTIKHVLIDGESIDQLICCSDASMCSCARSGVQCHIEGSSYCKCSINQRVSCINPEGAYRFDDNAVRLHAHRLLFGHHEDIDSPINQSPNSVPFSPSLSSTSSPMISPRSSVNLRSMSFSAQSSGLYDQSINQSINGHYSLPPNLTRRASRVSPPPSPLMEKIRAMNDGLSH